MIRGYASHHPKKDSIFRTLGSDAVELKRHLFGPMMHSQVQERNSSLAPQHGKVKVMNLIKEPVKFLIVSMISIWLNLQVEASSAHTGLSHLRTQA